MYQTLSDTFVALLLCTPVTWCRMPRKWKKNERTMAGEPNSPRTDGVFDKGGQPRNTQDDCCNGDSSTSKRNFH